MDVVVGWEMEMVVNVAKADYHHLPWVHSTVLRVRSGGNWDGEADVAGYRGRVRDVRCRGAGVEVEIRV